MPISDANDGIRLALALAFDMQMPGNFGSFLLSVKLALFSVHETQHKIFLHSVKERENVFIVRVSQVEGSRGLLVPGSAAAA